MVKRAIMTQKQWNVWKKAHPEYINKPKPRYGTLCMHKFKMDFLIYGMEASLTQLDQIYRLWLFNWQNNSKNAVSLTVNSFVWLPWSWSRLNFVEKVFSYRGARYSLRIWYLKLDIFCWPDPIIFSCLLPFLFLVLFTLLSFYFLGLFWHL